MATLMKGDRHPAVGLLQEKLNLFGASPPLAVDDDFGPHTKAAVLTFQQNSPKLSSMYGGIAGPETLDNLGIHLPVEQLVQKFPLDHNPTENWAANLSVRRVMYSAVDPDPAHREPGPLDTMHEYPG